MQVCASCKHRNYLALCRCMPVVHVCVDFRWVDGCPVCRHELQAYCFQTEVSASFPVTVDPLVKDHPHLKTRILLTSLVLFHVNKLLHQRLPFFLYHFLVVVVERWSFLRDFLSSLFHDNVGTPVLEVWLYSKLCCICVVCLNCLSVCLKAHCEMHGMHLCAVWVCQLSVCLKYSTLPSSEKYVTMRRGFMVVLTGTWLWTADTCIGTTGSRLRSLVWCQWSALWLASSSCLVYGSAPQPHPTTAMPSPPA